jgi:hypothetical protein
MLVFKQLPTFLKCAVPFLKVFNDFVFYFQLHQLSSAQVIKLFTPPLMLQEINLSVHPWKAFSA